MYSSLPSSSRDRLPPALYSPLFKELSKGLIRHTLSSKVSGLVFGLALLGSPLLSITALAQQVSPELRQEFLADPLTEHPQDPLLPILPIARPYSPLELSTLKGQLDQLNVTAQQQLAEGNVDAAFELWQRELRLRRVLGPLAEFDAIRRVAAVAWEQQRAVDVQLLTLRTREIWETVEAALIRSGEGVTEDQEDSEGSSVTALGDDPIETLVNNPEQVLVSGSSQSDVAVLLALAQTAATLRDIDTSVAVYQQLIDITVAQNGDPTAQQKELAELHLEWFQFANAADVYLALLTEARAKGNQVQAADYLERLVYSYQQAHSVTNAVRAQTDLIEIYQAQGQAEKLPGLLVAIAQNYRTLNKPKNAIEYYRFVYSAAQRFEQFSFSARALQDLGALYEALALNAEALGAYNLLVPVEQQSYNNYGIMNAYNKIGQLQRRQGNAFEALKAFEKALVIADQLNLRQDYFIEQIESVTQLPIDSQAPTDSQSVR